MNELINVREQLQSAIDSVDKILGLHNPSEFWRYELINRPMDQVDWSTGSPIVSSLKGHVDYDPATYQFFRFQFTVNRSSTNHNVSWQLGDGQERAGVLLEGAVTHGETLRFSQNGRTEANFRLYVGNNVLHWGIFNQVMERMSFTTTIYDCYLEGFREALWNRTDGYNNVGIEIGKRIN